MKRTIHKYADARAMARGRDYRKTTARGRQSGGWISAKPTCTKLVQSVWLRPRTDEEERCAATVYTKSARGRSSCLRAHDCADSGLFEGGTSEGDTHSIVTLIVLVKYYNFS